MRFNNKISNIDSLKLENLYKTHRNSMYFEAYKILNDEQLSEDVVHQSFVKIVYSLHKIDENNIPRTRRFLKIVSRNIALDMYNRRCRFSNSESLDDRDEDIVDNSASPSDILIKKEAEEFIYKTICELPEKYKDVIILERIYSYSLKDISKLLNIKYDTVKKRSERAKKLLGNILRKEELI